MNYDQYRRVKLRALSTSLDNIVRRLDNIFRKELRVRWELRVWEPGAREPIVVTGPGQVKVPPKRVEIIVVKPDTSDDP